MEEQKSFILYKDMQQAIETLPDLDCAQVFRTIFRYVKGEEKWWQEDEKTEINHMALVAFNFIKPHLDRNAEEWEKIRKAKSEAGKKGMEKRWGNRNKITKDNSVISVNNKNNTVKNKITDDNKNNYNVNVNDNVKDILTKVNMVAKPPGEKVLTNKKKDKFGNDRVNLLMDAFQTLYGFIPTDRKPRQEAWNLTRRVEKWFKDLGISNTEEKFKKTIQHYYKWLDNQDWEIQTMSTVRRKFPVFTSEMEGGGMYAKKN